MSDAGANADQGRSSNSETTRLLTTTISLSREDLELINRVALVRKFKRGRGRASVSDVVRDLINRHRAVLEDETQ